MGCIGAWPAQRGGDYQGLVPLDNVHQPAVLFDLGVLCLASYRTPVEMDKHSVSIDLCGWYLGLFRLI